MKKTVCFGFLVLVFLFGCVFPARALDITEIIAKANNAAYYAGLDGRSRVSMVITDSLGRIRKRVFTILRLDIKDGGGQKYYVYFNEPSDVKDMVYMVWKHLGRDDDRWMYLPALDLVRRIASADKRSSFIGSNFVYEDISGRSPDLDTHEEAPSDKLDYKTTYKIRNIPKDAQGVEFSYYDVYIRKDNFIPFKAEYYDKQGKLYRTIEALEIKDIQGYPTVVKSEAKDLTTGSNTVIEFSDIKYDIGLEDNIFTERYLRRPPRRWLQ